MKNKPLERALPTICGTFAGIALVVAVAAFTPLTQPPTARQGHLVTIEAPRAEPPSTVEPPPATGAPNTIPTNATLAFTGEVNDCLAGEVPTVSQDSDGIWWAYCQEAP